jgi:trans-2,3-dihydro-3-hydroxyanthranilate isomerase
MAENRSYRYRTVDVFTTQQFEGNPLAVFTDARGLETPVMQRIARELNLSESVFIFPAEKPDHTARLKIFTPARELPFAGHPTIGTSFVLYDEGAASKDAFVLEEGVGPVPVRIEHGNPPKFWLATPQIHDRETFDRAHLAKVLGLTIDDTLDLTPQILDAGNPTLFVAVRDQAAVDRASLELRDLKALRKEFCCVFVFTPTASGAYSRMFAPEYGIVEDPATGSSTGPLALYMKRNGLAPGAQFVSEQGTKMGRRSLLYINIAGDTIEVGGHATSVATGSMNVQ